MSLRNNPIHMTKILKFLKGKKTFLIALITAVFNCLLVFGVIALTPEQIIAIEGLLGALIGATIRLGIAKK